MAFVLDTTKRAGTEGVTTAVNFDDASISGGR
jgi:hypothetical protein